LLTNVLPMVLNTMADPSPAWAQSLTVAEDFSVLRDNQSAIGQFAIGHPKCDSPACITKRGASPLLHRRS